MGVESDVMKCFGRWGSKTFEPSIAGAAAPSSRRGGFEDRERGSFGSRELDDAGGISRADTEDRWSRRTAPAGPPLPPLLFSAFSSFHFLTQPRRCRAIAVTIMRRGNSRLETMLLLF